MELELKTRQMEVTKLVYNAAAAAEESGEAVVPDSLPDIVRIVETAAIYEPRSREVRGGRLYVDGLVRASVLYVPETGAGICRVGLDIPVSQVFELPDGIDERNTTLIVSAKLAHATARELNPRKITVRASVDFVCKAYVRETLSVYSGVEEAESFGVFCKTETVRALAPVGIREKTITISDSAELTGVSASGEILKADITAETTDYKQISDKIVLKGDAHVRVLVKTGDEEKPVVSGEALFPFSGVIDCAGVTEESRVQLSYSVGVADLQITSEAGTDRTLLAARVNLVVVAEAQEQVEFSLLTDAYSTSHQLQAEWDSISLLPVEESHSVKTTLRETIGAGVGIKSVYSCAVSTENVSTVMGEDGPKAVCDVSARLILEAEDGGVYALTKSIPVSADLPAGTSVSAALIKDESYHISDREDIELRAVLEFVPAAKTADEYKQIASITAGEPLPKPARTPAVTLCYGLAGESFWDLAKRLRTSEADIKGANDLSGEYPPEGRLLLVPRRS
jgi:hypothetical protein